MLQNHLSKFRFTCSLCRESQNTETQVLGGRERLITSFGQNERTEEQDLSNLSLLKNKSREFYAVRESGSGSSRELREIFGHT